MKQSLSYKDAGVDIAKADAFVERLNSLTRSTHTPKAGEVIPLTNAYAGLFRPQGIRDLNDPLLVAACDGVGTKLLIARDLNSYEGLGQDLVAMNVNDLLPSGAKPLFFLDYIATGKLDPQALEQIVSGIAKACREVGCVLLGGETAEMPGLYPKGDFDLAGFTVGMVDGEKLPQRTIEQGDIILALPSNGIHSNGLSLARKALFEHANYSLHDTFLNHTLGEELLRPTRLYVTPVLQLLEHFRFKAAAHITGGGLLGRLQKLGCSLTIDPTRYTVSEIFNRIEQAGSISKHEMASTFNMGLGFVIVVNAATAQHIVQKFPEWLEVGKVINTTASQVDLGYTHS